MIHFGLTPYASAFLYASFILAFLLSVLWRPIVGIYFLVPLIPLQTARYYLIDFPLGKSVVDIILLGVVLGLLVHRQRVLHHFYFCVAVPGFLLLRLGASVLHK